MLHVNHAREPHVNIDSFTLNAACLPLPNQDSHTECCTFTMHGSHTLLDLDLDLTVDYI